MDRTADFDAYIGSNGVALDARDVALLRAIESEGSLNAAADSLGRSFSHAQRRVVELEDAFGSLVERRRGGAGGGGSELTDTAEDLLARYERLRSSFEGVAEVAETVLRGTVVERDGELATVETDAGPVRALVPEGDDAVDVTLRADAVTLNAPDDVPVADATSARNRFTGEVEAVERGETIARVAVDVGADAPVLALLTHESLERLGLESGDEVVATFKATATRAVPV
ncbi:TOBE domain-containing protein [Haloarculaceae archaeon H-GB2-1]|nr:TOBE domain-containing protein [Haloarculaceae archaeon H-GB1-1]MEA5387819.1 TOBE domain-containing protein [Haloarculaceae archaeon H-GB11]MEA5409318.1 TOBE domain-containing protein [Haloarculaceae archaeon H-GB2-1]